MFYLVKYSTFGIREIVIPKTVKTITSRLYSFYTGSNEIIPEIPLKILCEKESKIDSYSSNNDDSYYFYSKNKPSTEGKFWHYINNEPTIW